jgi:hypothetical protein
MRHEAAINVSSCAGLRKVAHEGACRCQKKEQVQALLWSRNVCCQSSWLLQLHHWLRSALDVLTCSAVSIRFTPLSRIALPAQRVARCCNVITRMHTVSADIA